jgi:hypothetical protein
VTLAGLGHNGAIVRSALLDTISLSRSPISSPHVTISHDSSQYGDSVSIRKSRGVVLSVTTMSVGTSRDISSAEVLRSAGLSAPVLRLAGGLARLGQAEGAGSDLAGLPRGAPASLASYLLNVRARPAGSQLVGEPVLLTAR